MKKSLGAKILIVPTPVWCIGTYNENGNPNVMTASWAGVCCSEPPCLAISLRKATHTYGNLMRSKVFTVSVPSKKYAKEADYVGIASGRKIDKFKACQLTPVVGEFVNAPFVGEFPLVLECKIIHILELGLHTQFIGQVLDVKADEEFLTPSGILDAGKIDPFLYSPADQEYYSTGPKLGDAFEVVSFPSK